ncbi:hypothetical protein TNCV_482441 [Trichonephila clavipes]|uniref:Uncharacterized protein n=1 Tax=Trichonephila clavipes TaxID=2585209 RepID=A0A8X6S8W8_TRICX|nr:hypothetical protein TNCV_482441 [Trichonephila clavipes]
MSSYLLKQALFGGVPPFLKAFLSYSFLKGALGCVAVTPFEKAKVIADSLGKQFEPNTGVENPIFSAHTHERFKNVLALLPLCQKTQRRSSTSGEPLSYMLIEYWSLTHASAEGFDFEYYAINPKLRDLLKLPLMAFTSSLK